MLIMKRISVPRPNAAVWVMPAQLARMLQVSQSPQTELTVATEFLM